MSATDTLSLPLLTNFTARGDELAARGPDWIRTWRRRARLRFEELGLPTTREEAWRSTNLAPLAGTAFVPAAHGGRPAPFEDRLPPAARLDLGGPRLVFVDGRFAAELSSNAGAADGVWAGSLAGALAEAPDRVRAHLTGRDPAEAPAFDALNAALHEDGAVVMVEEGVEIARPVQLVFWSSGGESPTANHPRTLVVAGRSSRLRLVECYAGTSDGVYLTNTVTELVVEAGARVDGYRVQMQGANAFHLSSTFSRQARDSRCTLHQFDLGGRLVRHDVVSVLDGEGSDCRLHGLYLTDGEQHVDHHTLLDHAQPHASSRELYKGILAGRSRTVFNGRILVRQAAQQTDAKQSNQNLLLSEGALARTRPQLEIYADDVKCTHGATMGRLDEDGVFYLRSRGIDETAARNLMIVAFAGEVLEAIEIDDLRRELEREVGLRLPQTEARDLT